MANLVRCYLHDQIVRAAETKMSSPGLKGIPEKLVRAFMVKGERPPPERPLERRQYPEAYGVRDDNNRLRTDNHYNSNYLFSI